MPPTPPARDGTWLDEAYRMPGLPLSREAPDPEPQREGPGELG